MSVPNAPTPDISGKVEIDGVSIHYDYFGDKTKPVVVVFNGVSMETRSWFQFLPFFGDGVDKLFWDFRGQGQSTSDDQPYDVCAHADYLKKIIETLALKPEQTNLIGISSGSIIEAEFLRQHSAMVNKAVLSGVLLSPEKTFIYGSEFGIKLLREGMLDLWAETLYGTLFSSAYLEVIEPFIPKLKAALSARYKDRALALARIIEAQMNYVINVKNYYDDFKKVDVPMLLIAGEEDVLTPPFVQKKVLDLFGRTPKYLEYAGCGHMMAMERSKDFFGDAVNFVLS
ncbi:MAG: alpha/beta hydrolase [Proteobacteria bacterium]|nr:alpha/beta hydrolase [Pseudomonadota bacterium]